MAKQTRVVIIDDEMDHLTGLADGLVRNGVPCLRIHYKGELPEIPPCPDVRVVIADLHLGSGALGSDPTTDFAVLGTILEEIIKPAGHYIILLWTMYPDHAGGLEKFLKERLLGVAQPEKVLPVAKPEFLDGAGRVTDEDRLNRQIDGLADGWIRARGALALLGAWRDLEDEEMDELAKDIHSARYGDEPGIEEAKD